MVSLWDLGEEGLASVQHKTKVRFPVERIQCQNLTESNRGNIKDRARYLRQSVVLGGAGANAFSDMLDRVGLIYSELSRAVPAGQLQPLTLISEDGSQSTLDVSNRYFTSRRDEAHGQAYTLDADTDPHGYLAQLAGEDLFHGEDNTVSYFQLSSRDPQTNTPK